MSRLEWQEHRTAGGIGGIGGGSLLLATWVPSLTHVR